MPQLSRATAAKSVLVVEDDADIRETLSGLLSGEGYDVRTCANGLEALERLRRGDHPDVIVLDLMMPVMDGWQFRVHQKRDPRIASIPVLAISADTTPKAAAIDADAYLRKPVDYDALIDTIERTILDMERRRLQATQAETERLASLGTLAAGVAHEINNPLAYVIANLAFVAQALDEEGDERAPLKEALEEARDGCERIRTIVRDLQLFSRASDDERMVIDVRRVLDSSANIVMNEIRSRARLVKEYGEVPPIEGNESRVGQVLLNILLNAAQAIPEGNVAAHEIRLVTRADDRGGVVIEVHDDGVGIPTEVRARIFDPFFTTKPVGVGTGLGLSIAYRIVTSMKGELTVDSEPGKGTTFRVRFPGVNAPPSSKMRRARPASPRNGSPRARILVIDDEEMIGVMLARVLGHAHRVEATTHPDEAIERIRNGERFDLILCDLMMPERSGEEVQRLLESIAPEQAERILFLTGGAFSAKAQEFLSRQKHPVVEKPFVVEELLSRIDQTLASFAPLKS